MTTRIEPCDTSTLDLDYGVREVRRALAHAENQASTASRGDDRLYWTAQIDAYRHALAALGVATP